MSTPLRPLEPDIAARLGHGFEKNVLSAALLSLEQEHNPLRLNNFATAIRELSRIVLHRLAPDDEIAACSWYRPKNDRNGQRGITRADRITYPVQAGLTEDFVKNTLMLDVKKMRKDLVGTVHALNKFTHITPEVFGVGGSALDHLVTDTLEALLAFLEMIGDCRDSVVSSVETRVRRALHEELLTHTIAELDALATHYNVEHVHVDTLRLTSMDSAYLKFSVTGFVECRLQYGSSGDVRRGDGWVTNDCYPLTCDFESDAATPLDLRALRSTLRVDNECFYR